MRGLRVCWPVLGRSRIYLLQARADSHGPPAKLKVGAEGEGGRVRVRETPAGGKGERATQVEP